MRTRWGTHRKVIHYKGDPSAKFSMYGHHNVPYPPSTSMFPLSHKGGSKPTSVIEAPKRDVMRYSSAGAIEDTYG